MTDTTPPSEEVLRHVEKWGLLFEESQLPPVAGRIWGWLLLSESGATSRELCQALGITKGAVSTSARLLQGAGLVERRRQPGSRAYSYRVRDDAQEALLDDKLQAVEKWRDLARDGAELARDEGLPPDRLQGLAEFYDFLRDWQLRLRKAWRQRKEEAP